MLILIDKKIPKQAKEELAKYGELLELESKGITYDAISGHPDIFFHQTPDKLIAAPNTPEKYLSALRSKGIEVLVGEQPVGEKYPASSAYNAVSVNNLLIHNFRNTDSVITSALEDADLIHVDQGYTRCNILALDDQHFITSDEKVKRVLDRFQKDCLYVSPEGIILPGYKHGFFGGCCGLQDKKVFIIGSLKHFGEGESVKGYLLSNGFETIELYHGQLFDGGSILFIGNA
ncbi:MAG: hypothetical protein V2I47_05585 [Bacteroidales bacterium]|jgi:hypothetical protein|nr:hypothetical protein [Bacteroidales bacterium]